jgi:hypothetical protein
MFFIMAVQLPVQQAIKTIQFNRKSQINSNSYLRNTEWGTANKKKLLQLHKVAIE